MVQRFFSPDQQFADSAGLPYAGGTLSFYATGTSTPLATYSDSSLAIANTNPIVLDSAGRAGSVFLQNLPYKVVLADVNNVQIWTEDPVWSSDYSAFAQFQPFAGNPNGFVAGTAGTQGALPGSSSVWDYVNDILYVATTTGNAATTVWTAVNTPTTNTVTPAPGGYLTLASDPSNPILTTDSIGSTSVFYTPYVSNTVPIYNGTTFASTVFTQLTLTLTASQAADTVYDVFVFNNSGVPTLVTGPAWTTSTAGSGARGTGAGTTQIQRLNGLWVNQVQISGKNSSTTYSINANLATYLGTIYVDHTAGQVTCHRNPGRNRKFGVWNAYSRVPIILDALDTTANWTYTTNTYRAANNTPSTYAAGSWNVGSGTAVNGIVVLQGLPEEEVTSSYKILISPDGANVPDGAVGVGVNSITALSGAEGRWANGTATGASSTEGRFDMSPFLGLRNVAAIEIAPSGISTQFNGTSVFMLLRATWRG